MKQEFELHKTDRLVCISAMIISLLTLIMFTYQTYIMREQSRLQVKPKLHMRMEHSAKGGFKTFKQILVNKGLGPAVIQDCKLAYQNKDYKLSIGELAEDKFPDYNKCTHSDEVEDITKGMFISPKDTVVIFGFKIIEEDYSDYIKYLDFDTETEDPRWNIELSYSSIYEEMDWDLE